MVEHSDQMATTIRWIYMILTSCWTLYRRFGRYANSMEGSYRNRHLYMSHGGLSTPTFAAPANIDLCSSRIRAFHLIVWVPSPRMRSSHGSRVPECAWGQPKLWQGSQEGSGSWFLKMGCPGRGAYTPRRVRKSCDTAVFLAKSSVVLVHHLACCLLHVGLCCEVMLTLCMVVSRITYSTATPTTPQFKW